MSIANDFLMRLPVAHTIKEAKLHSADVFLCPENIICELDEESQFTFSESLPKGQNAKDLIRIIEVVDPLNVEYKKTNILSPLAFVESMEDIPWHISTQGLLFTRISAGGKTLIERLRKESKYGKHAMDSFWLACSKLLEAVSPEDPICIFNRRIDGWDGSPERPVIELLGAGGHLPTVFKEESNSFSEISCRENFVKEFQEELGLDINPCDITIFGGFVNKLRHELVVLCGIYIGEEMVEQVYNHAVSGQDPDTGGIYMGSFYECLSYYLENPDYFAGGSAAVATNFASNCALMARVQDYLSKAME